MTVAETTDSNVAKARCHEIKQLNFIEEHFMAGKNYSLRLKDASL
jgi:hypothetical protein